MNPVVSENWITTESTDNQCVGILAPGPIWNRARGFRTVGTPSMDVMKEGKVGCRDRLGGLLHYYRDAA